MDLQGDGMNMLSIYSTTTASTVATPTPLEPVSLTTNAQPGNGF